MIVVGVTFILHTGCRGYPWSEQWGDGDYHFVHIECAELERALRMGTKNQRGAGLECQSLASRSGHGQELILKKILAPPSLLLSLWLCGLLTLLHMLLLCDAFSREAPSEANAYTAVLDVKRQL